jgi:RNA-directed DNA polymerase
VHGTREDAVQLREEIAGVLSTMGLRLSQEKTLITHIDDGLDFLGWRLQRHRKKGATRQYIYTYPAKKALKAIMAKVKMLCRTIGPNQPLQALLDRINSAVRGWCAYFRVGVSSATFSYLSSYLWASVWRWIRRKHPTSTWKQLRRQYCGGGWWPASKDIRLFNPSIVTTDWYRYRGTKIPDPWPVTG